MTVGDVSPPPLAKQRRTLSSTSVVPAVLCFILVVIFGSFAFSNGAFGALGGSLKQEGKARRDGGHHRKEQVDEGSIFSSKNTGDAGSSGGRTDSAGTVGKSGRDEKPQSPSTSSSSSSTSYLYSLGAVGAECLQGAMMSNSTKFRTLCAQGSLEPYWCSMMLTAGGKEKQRRLRDILRTLDMGVNTIGGNQGNTMGRQLPSPSLPTFSIDDYALPACAQWAETRFLGAATDHRRQGTTSPGNKAQIPREGISPFLSVYSFANPVEVGGGALSGDHIVGGSRESSPSSSSSFSQHFFKMSRDSLEALYQDLRRRAQMGRSIHNITDNHTGRNSSSSTSRNDDVNTNRTIIVNPACGDANTFGGSVIATASGHYFEGRTAAESVLRLAQCTNGEDRGHGGEHSATNNQTAAPRQRIANPFEYLPYGAPIAAILHHHAVIARENFTPISTPSTTTTTTNAPSNTTTSARGILISGDSMMRQMLLRIIGAIRGEARLADHHFHVDALYVVWPDRDALIPLTNAVLNTSAEAMSLLDYWFEGYTANKYEDYAQRRNQYDPRVEAEDPPPAPTRDRLPGGDEAPAVRSSLFAVLFAWGPNPNTAYRPAMLKKLSLQIGGLHYWAHRATGYKRGDPKGLAAYHAAMDAHLAAHPHQRIVFTTIPFNTQMNPKVRVVKNIMTHRWLLHNHGYYDKEEEVQEGAARKVVKRRVPITTAAEGRQKWLLDFSGLMDINTTPERMQQQGGGGGGGQGTSAAADPSAVSLSSSPSAPPAPATELGGAAGPSQPNQQGAPLAIPKITLDQTHFMCGLQFAKYPAQIDAVKDNGRHMGCRDPMNEALMQWLMALLLRL